MRSSAWFLLLGMFGTLVGACAAPIDNPSVQTGELSASHATGDADASSSADGEPDRRACTSRFGSGLTGGSFGRLDGYLVSIVQPGGHTCSSDAHHIHLQILMNNAVYDVAANVANDVEMSQAEHAPIGAAWSEGWHSDSTLDYPADLGLHAADFSSETQASLASNISDALTTANHVSIYATKYGKGGIHLVHRNGRGHDGAIVLNPLGAKPSYLTFHFSDQSF